MRKIIIISLFIIIGLNSKAQKINTDSLLTVANRTFTIDRNIEQTIVLSKIGIKNAPDYLDFHLLLGRAYWENKAIDSARSSFNHVIEKNSAYKDAFTYLTKLELEQNNTEAANQVIDKAISIYPDEIEFYKLKHTVLNKQDKDEQTILNYLQSVRKKFPEDKQIQSEIAALQLKDYSDRIGLTYNYTAFSRDGVGPWHLTSLQYIRERETISLIGRINYTDRRAFGESINSGFQYEAEGYIKHSIKNYSFANIAIGDDDVFPKLRLSYSFFQSFAKTWEADLGFRYIKTSDPEIYSLVAGLGKYFGNYWLNLKSYWQFEDGKTYPAFIATGRYYLDTKYDYVTVLAGYGTSPDERNTLGQYQQRIALNSYRAGAGYYKLLWQNYCVGIQGIYNRQEYSADKYQTELDLMLSLFYKF